MKNKKIVILFIIVIIICIIGIIFFAFKKEEKNNIVTINAETTVEQRTEWNNFLNSNPYLAQIENITEYISEQDLIKLAITSENVETEYIDAEEIEQNPVLTYGEGYKKSKKNINEYLKNFLGKEELAYNFVETYLEEDKYLLVDNNYIYFTKIDLPEKIYIAVKYEEKEGNFEVEIYEYDVTDETREELKTMLETGIANDNAKSKYALTGQNENGNIKLNSKICL